MLERKERILLIIAIFLVCHHPARADIRELFQFINPDHGKLTAAPNTTDESVPRQVVLNGVPLHLLIGRSTETPEDIMGHYKQLCTRPKSGVSQLSIRQQSGLDYAMMIDPTPFLRPAPLCMAYAYSSQGQTDYMAIWSDGPVPAGALSISEEKDAPGSEAPGVPRPHGALRSFNLAEPAAGYVIVSYLLADPPEAALRQTVNQLTAAGFSMDGSFARAASKPGNLLIRLERPGQDVLVSALPRRNTAHGSLILYMVRLR